MVPPGREPQSLGTKNSHGALEVAFVGTGIKRALGGGGDGPRWSEVGGKCGMQKKVYMEG